MSNDQQLLTKAQQLNTKALQEFHRRFYGMVARYIQFKIGNPQTVEDLSGEVFVRALEAFQQGQGWRDSPQGWIMGIARNVVAGYYRRQSRTTEVQLDERLTASEAEHPLQRAIRSEQSERLTAAINQLTDEQREVIMLRFIEGLDIKSTAQALKKTEGAIKGLQYRATQALAELMESPVTSDESR